MAHIQLLQVNLGCLCPVPGAALMGRLCHAAVAVAEGSVTSWLMGKQGSQGGESPEAVFANSDVF